MASSISSLAKLSVSLLLVSASQAAVLYERATIISYNDVLRELAVLRNASLLIEADRITALSEEPISVPANTTRIDATDKIISPGFIDTHHHLWQTAFKTIGSNTSLADYFQKFGEYGPAEQHFTPEDLYVGQLAGALELIHEGTTTVLDHAHASWSDETVDACVNATMDSGVRTFYAHAIHEIPNGYSWETQLAKLTSLAQDPRFDQSRPQNLNTLGLAWDFFWNAPEANVTTLWNLTKSLNLSVVTTHFLGGPFSDTNSPTVLQQHGWLNDTVPILFSHASFMTYSDANLLRETNQYISTTPESELHFGHNHPDAHLIQDQVALGVDCHFTYSSSMVQQARLWLQSLRAPNYLAPLENFQVPRNSPMSAEQAFHLITRAGALALRRDDLGVINVGAKADIVVFGTDAPNMLGWSDPVAAIILHSDPGNIEDVLVDGKFVKKGGKLVYPDYASLRKRMTKSAEKIQRIWTQEIDWPELTGTLTEGAAPYGDTEVIDTQRGDGSGYHGQEFAGQ